MPTVTADQGLTLPVDADTADAPVAFQSYNAGVEPRLNRRYTNLADRTARYTSNVVGDQTFLQAELRSEYWNGSNHLSALVSDHFTYVRMGSDQVLTSSSTTLQNITALVSALPTTGTFGFRAVIFNDASQISDIKFALTWPAGANALWGIMGLAVGATATTGDGQFATASVSGGALAVGTAGVGTITMTILEGEIAMGGTAGNLQLQAAQNTSDATAITIRNRSRFQVWRSA